LSFGFVRRPAVSITVNVSDCATVDGARADKRKKNKVGEFMA
jgi:hypothetical protein